VSQTTARQLLAPISILSGVEVRLFLTSATLLFVELLLIRWIPANVIYVGYFSNFILIASFLGIGLGILFGRVWGSLAVSPFALLLFGVVVLVLRAQLNVLVDPEDQIFFGLEYSTAADTNYLVLPLVMALVVALMAMLALPLGGLLRSLPPLRAYAIDIAGALAGIAGFGLLSVLGFEPFAWFTVVAVLLTVLALGRGITAWSAVPVAAMIGVLALVGAEAGRFDLWSPYYRISTYDLADRAVSARTGSGQQPAYVHVNGIGLEALVAPDDVAGTVLHRRIYEWLPDRTFDRVLVIGAGTGNDVGLALARGSQHVDAVEIDPVIARIGRDFQPGRPYSDPRVTLHVDDGRAFLRRATGDYDLIIFALTDSLTLVTSTANVRLESFLFTEESFRAARDHLSEDGVFVMYNAYREPWLVAKLDAMASAAFGHEPLRWVPGSTQPGSSRAVIAAGPGVVEAVAAGRVAAEVNDVPAIQGVAPTPATDDWPFLYLRNPAVATYYLVALAVLLAFAAILVGLASRVTRVPLRGGFSPHFFVLGVAFLLLETRSLVTFSLLFGTTWSVNALVFFAILLSVLISIGISARFPARRPALLYVGLFATLGLAWLLPPERLLLDPPALRYALASAVAFAPIIFANLIFANSFRDTSKADMAFASNLLGAVVGGALEYVALLTGYRALLLVVAILYIAAYVFAGRFRLLADRDLERIPVAEAGAVRAAPEAA
jgi:SAM-dependent methyltransferase